MSKQIVLVILIVMIEGSVFQLRYPIVGLVIGDGLGVLVSFLVRMERRVRQILICVTVSLVTAVNTAIYFAPDEKTQLVLAVNAYVALKAGGESIVKRKDVRDFSTRIVRDVERVIVQLRPAHVIPDGREGAVINLIALEPLTVPATETVQSLLVTELNVGVMLDGWVLHVKQSVSMVLLKYPQMTILPSVLAITATVVSRVKWSVQEEALVQMTPVIVVLMDGGGKHVRARDVRGGVVTAVVMVPVLQL